MKKFKVVEYKTYRVARIVEAKDHLEAYAEFTELQWEKPKKPECMENLKELSIYEFGKPKRIV